MSVRLAPLIIISSVRICAACSDCLRLRSSAIVSPLRLACCTMLALCCRYWDQSRRAKCGPLSLWQGPETLTVPNGIVHCHGGRQGANLPCRSLPGPRTFDRRNRHSQSFLVLKILSKSAVFDELHHLPALFEQC